MCCCTMILLRREFGIYRAGEAMRASYAVYIVYLNPSLALRNYKYALLQPMKFRTRIRLAKLSTLFLVGTYIVDNYISEW